MIGANIFCEKDDIKIYDLLNLAQANMEQFAVNDSAVEDQYRIRGLHCFSSTGLQELRNETAELIQEMFQNNGTFWLKSSFELDDPEQYEKHLEYQKMNWILEEIYGVFKEQVPEKELCGEKFRICTSLEESIQCARSQDTTLLLKRAQNCQDKIKWFDVTLKLDKNTFKAEILFPNRAEEESVQYYYYLMKDGVTQQRCGWTDQSIVCFDVEESGSYCVQGYVKTRTDKVWRRSAAVNYYTKEDQQQFDLFMKEFAGEDTDLGVELPYHPTQQPFCDFVIVAPKKRWRGYRYDDFMQAQSCFQIAAHEKIGKQDVTVFATGGIRKTNSGETLLFSGITELNGKLIQGAGELPDDVSIDQLETGYGINHSILISKDQLRLGTDLFHYGQWFYYEAKDMMVISNRYHALLLCLQSMKVPLKLDEEKASVILSTMSIQFLMQNFSRSMDLKPVIQLEHDHTLVLDRFGWSRQQTRLGEIAQMDRVYHESLYRMLVPKAAEEIRSQVAMVLNDSRTDNVFVDLTGGLDSRLIYAAVTSMPRELILEKVKIFSKDVPGSKDLEIATKLNGIYRIPYDDVGQAKRNLLFTEADRSARSYYMGRYYVAELMTLETTYPSPNGKIMQHLSGGHGDTLRPLYGRKYFHTMAEHAATRELAEYLLGDFSANMLAASEVSNKSFVELVKEEMEQMPFKKALKSYDEMYLRFRSNYHFDFTLRSEGTPMEWHPLQSRTAYQLQLMTFEEFKGIRLELDLIGQLNPLLLGIELDYPQDDEELNRYRGRLHIQENCLKNIRLELQSNRTEWDEANKRRDAAAVSKKNAPAVEQACRDQIGRKAQSYQNATLRNFHHLMENCPVLRKQMGTALYLKIRDGKLKDCQQLSLYNKITSLMDQVNLTQQR